MTTSFEGFPKLGGGYLFRGPYNKDYNILEPTIFCHNQVSQSSKLYSLHDLHDVVKAYCIKKSCLERKQAKIRTNLLLADLRLARGSSPHMSWVLPPPSNSLYSGSY